MKFTQRYARHLQDDRRRAVAGAAGDARDLVGRRPRRRRLQLRARAGRGPSPRRPSTTTAPSAAQPFNRTITQPGSPGDRRAAATARAAASSTGRAGLLGGLAAGFLGAGLLGMLFGGGMFSRPRRLVVDPRPDAADRPDRVRGAAGDVVVAAPPDGRRARLCRRLPRRPRARAHQHVFGFSGMGFGLGSGSAPLRDPARRL